MPSGHFAARARYRDWGGRTREVQSAGATAKAAEWSLKEKFAEPLSLLTKEQPLKRLGQSCPRPRGLHRHRILANREHRLPTMIVSQTRPAYWDAEVPDRVAVGSIVNRVANHARIINLGQIDMRRRRNE